MDQKLIMYASKALVTPGNSGTASDLTSLVRHSQVQNKIHGITGALYSSHRRFLQIIEGESKAVDRLMVNILKDNRHENCLIQLDTKITERTFTGWEFKLVMAVASDRDLRNFVTKYSEQLKSMPSEARIAFNHFFKKRTLKRDVNIVSGTNSIGSLDIFGNQAMSLIELPDLSTTNSSKVMIDLCDLLKQRPHSVDELVSEFGSSKRYEIVALLKDFNSQGLIQFDEG